MVARTIDFQQWAILIAAALGALGASVAALIVAGKQSRTQIRLAERQTKVKAFEDALRLTETLRDWSIRTKPMLENSSDPKPELPSGDVQISARTLVELHGSERVRTAFKAVETAMREFFNHAQDIHSLQNPPATATGLERGRERGRERELYQQLPIDRTVLADSITALVEVMRADLKYAK